MGSILYRYAVQTLFSRKRKTRHQCFYGFQPFGAFHPQQACLRVAVNLLIHHEFTLLFTTMALYVDENRFCRSQKYCSVRSR